VVSGPSADRQRIVSVDGHRCGVPDEHSDLLLRRLIGGVPGAAADVVRSAPTSTSAPLIAAAALVSHERDLLTLAALHATSTRDRQLVVLADTLLRGDSDLLDVLLRDHLAAHRDHLMAAWIAGLPPPS
jgi:hypothetical protein